MHLLFHLSDGYKHLQGECLQRWHNETGDDTHPSARGPFRCLYPEYFADLITTPIFIVNSLYDSSEIGATLGLNCNVDATCTEHDQGEGKSADDVIVKRKQQRPCCLIDELKAASALKAFHLKAMSGVLRKPTTGFFMPNCIAHTLLGHRSWRNHSRLKMDGPGPMQGEAAALQTPETAFRLWMQERLTLGSAAEGAMTGSPPSKVRLLDKDWDWTVSTKRKRCYDEPQTDTQQIVNMDGDKNRKDPNHGFTVLSSLSKREEQHQQQYC